MSTFTFNFLPQFVGPIERGEKRQTVRKLRKDGRRPVPGDTAALYTGLRTKATRVLKEALVTKCCAVRIMFGHPAQLLIDGRLVEPDERSEFAKADGFESWPAMVAWFREHHGANGSGSFDGFCVVWV